MSHVVSIETKILDLDALKVAVKELGFEWLEGKKTYTWFGRFLGDSPMPKDTTLEELGSCEHAIRVPGAKYEVGVARAVGGGYTLRYDFWGPGGLKKVIGENAGPIVHAYAVQKTLKQAQMMGRGVLSKRTLENGAVEIVLQGR